MADVRMIACPKCGTANRVPRAKLDAGLKPACGRCKQPLDATASANPVTVTDATFSTEIERSAVPVLVDAWAPWCGPCRTIAPIIDQLASELAGRVKVAKLNVGENPMTAARFNLRSIPTLLVFKNGKE